MTDAESQRTYIREVRVEFRKTVSDGNYGNETFSASYTVVLAEGEDGGGVTQALCVQLREHVYARLKESPNAGIRQALETPEERQARYEAERAQYEAERQGRLAEVAAARDADEQDEDDDSPF
ncbi:MAG: hypothetical protein ACRDJN_32245 [Chloroflexota bacterium]